MHLFEKQKLSTSLIYRFEFFTRKTHFTKKFKKVNSETNLAPYFSETLPISGQSVDTQISSKHPDFFMASMVHARRGCPFNILIFFPGIPLLPETLIFPVFSSVQIKRHFENVGKIRLSEQRGQYGGSNLGR